MRNIILASVFNIVMVTSINLQDPVVEAAKKFVDSHKHGKACMEAFSDAESIIGVYDTHDKHKETAEVVADKIREVSGKSLDQLDEHLHDKLMKATAEARPLEEPEGDIARQAAIDKIRSPLHAAELCQHALRHHDEL